MRAAYLLVFLFAVCATVRCQDDTPADPDGTDLDPDTERAEAADVATEADDEADGGGATVDVEPPPAEKVQYVRPTVPDSGVYFYETFDDLAGYRKRWIKSQAKKDGADSEIAKYDGLWEVEEPSDSKLIGDVSLVLKSKAHHHAIGTILDKTFQFIDKPFIMQYEVRFKNGMECGGAYVKLLTKQASPNLVDLHDKTPYTIMFGPDKCGNDHKLHFIFRHKNPITGEFEEKHAKKPTETLDSYFTDKKTHTYRLVVNPDNTFEVRIDNTVINEGSLLKDFEPPVNPPKEIDDPDDSKPKDWDDRQKIKDPDAEKPADWDEDAPEKIEDPDATKPEGWLDDEEELVPDPDAQKPADWDDDMDGEWEAPKINNPKCAEAPGCGEWKPPMIKNPDYKGKWTAPFIDNPEYQGIWKPRRIPNPKFFEDLEPFKMTPIYALGLELWSMTDEIVFDNFIVTDDVKVADDWTSDTFTVKSKQEAAGSSTSGQSVVGAISDATKERPWLWAVLIIVVVLPIVLIIAYCCFSGSKSDDAAASRKKTDEPSADDPAVTEELDDKAVGDSDAVNTRGDLEADEATTQKSDDESKTSDKEGGEGGEGEGTTAGDDEAELEGENDTKESTTGSPRQSPRKRKTRKE